MSKHRGSALGTSAWNRLRASWALRLRIDGPLPCGKCGLPVSCGDEWDLGHKVPRALGGTDADGIWPEHAACNRSHGAHLGNRLRRQYPGPSRNW